MRKSLAFLSSFIPFLLVVQSFYKGEAITSGTPDGSELWGYIEVRPKAHMFWWYYKSPYRFQYPDKPWPVILWLQGGPGASGVGIGNFREIGPLDLDLNPRNSTWLQIADLLFVDNPVGTGYSYVENGGSFVTTDEEAGIDLTTLLVDLYNGDKGLPEGTLYIVAESYGGKYAVTLALSALEAIKTGKLKLNLGGVALGDSWISPEDFVFSWGPLLKDVSRLDDNGFEKSNSLAQQIKQQLDIGHFKDATDLWNQLVTEVYTSSNGVDMYNFLLDSGGGAASSVLDTALSSSLGRPTLSTFMNGVIREKLKIIPSSVRWGGQSDLVVQSLNNDFLKPRIKEVDMLLAKGVNVTVYNGQLDVICATKGTESWISKLKWEGLQMFLSLDRTPLYCGHGKATGGFSKSYRNFHFYWILKAGHMVPAEQPCVALEMASKIIKTPVVLSEMRAYSFER